APYALRASGWRLDRLLLRRLRRRRNESLNLLHRVIDLDVEGLLAERDGRATRIAADAVVLSRRRIRISRLSASPAAFPRGRDGVAFGRRNQLFAHPALVAAEIEHRRSIRNAGMRAARIAMGDEPVVEVALRRDVHAIAVEHVLALRRILPVH